MRAAAQRLAQVAGQAADIGAGAAGHVQAQALAVVGEHVDGVDLDLALRRLDCLAAARLGIQRLAALLQRRIDRRALANASAQRRQRRLQGRRIDRRHRPGTQHRAVGVVAVGAHPEYDLGFIGLSRAQQQPGQLGRLAEAQRQQAGGQRIQATGMAALLGTEQPPRRLQRRVGTHAGRLVEQHDAVEAAEGNAGQSGAEDGHGGIGTGDSGLGTRKSRIRRRTVRPAMVQAGLGKWLRNGSGEQMQ